MQHSLSRPVDGSAAPAYICAVNDDLPDRIRACRLCATRFAATATRHAPRPVVWFAPGAPVLVVGQAPGIRAHEAQKPFYDASGRRLREWMGVDEATFYDTSRIAIGPMAFCFPGYNAAGSDLPPPPICSATWRDEMMQTLSPRLILLIGSYAQRWHLGAEATRGGVAATVARWREVGPLYLPLPHPSWRNTGWLNRNPWFAAEVLPVLRARLEELL